MINVVFPSGVQRCYEIEGSVVITWLGVGNDPDTIDNGDCELSLSLVISLNFLAQLTSEINNGTTMQAEWLNGNSSNAPSMFYGFLSLKDTIIQEGDGYLIMHTKIVSPVTVLDKEFNAWSILNPYSTSATNLSNIIRYGMSGITVDNFPVNPPVLAGTILENWNSLEGMNFSNRSLMSMRKFINLYSQLLGIYYKWDEVNNKITWESYHVLTLLNTATLNKGDMVKIQQIEYTPLDLRDVSLVFKGGYDTYFSGTDTLKSTENLVLLNMFNNFYLPIIGGDYLRPSTYYPLYGLLRQTWDSTSAGLQNQITWNLGAWMQLPQLSTDSIETFSSTTKVTHQIIDAQVYGKLRYTGNVSTIKGLKITGKLTAPVYVDICFGGIVPTYDSASHFVLLVPQSFRITNHGGINNGLDVTNSWVVKLDNTSYISLWNGANNFLLNYQIEIDQDTSSDQLGNNGGAVYSIGIKHNGSQTFRCLSIAIYVYCPNIQADNYLILQETLYNTTKNISIDTLVPYWWLTYYSGSIITPYISYLLTHKRGKITFSSTLNLIVNRHYRYEGIEGLLYEFYISRKSINVRQGAGFVHTYEYEGTLIDLND